MAGALVALGLAIAVSPLRRPLEDQVSGQVSAAIPSEWLQASEPLAALVGPAGLVGIDRTTLLRELAMADAAWTPRV